MLPVSASNGCRKPYLQHPLHDPSGMVSYFVVSKRSRTYDALQDASAPVCPGAILKIVFESVVEATLLGLHVFLISSAPSSSASIPGVLMRSLPRSDSFSAHERSHEHCRLGRSPFPFVLPGQPNGRALGLGRLLIDAVGQIGGQTNHSPRTHLHYPCGALWKRDHSERQWMASGSMTSSAVSYASMITLDSPASRTASPRCRCHRSHTTSIDGSTSTAARRASRIVYDRTNPN